MNMNKTQVLSYAMLYSCLVFSSRLALVGLTVLAGVDLSIGGAVLLCYACHVFAGTWAAANLWAISAINEKNLNAGLPPEFRHLH
jgi:hypothetical protein